VELEPVEPAHRGLAAPRIGGKELMLGDAGVLADAQAGRVDKTDASTSAQLGVQVDR
jgi:hypothetical protein